MEDKSCSRGKGFSLHKSNSPLRRTRQVDKPVSKQRQRSLDWSAGTRAAPGFYNPTIIQRGGESMRRDLSSSKRRRGEAQAHSSHGTYIEETIISTRLVNQPVSKPRQHSLDSNCVTFPAPDFFNPTNQRGGESKRGGTQAHRSPNTYIEETITTIDLNVVAFPVQDFHIPLIIQGNTESKNCKVCSSGGDESEAQSSDNANIQWKNFKLPGVPCQFCGRQYGTASIGIHGKQCPAKGKQKIDPKKGKIPLRREPEKDQTIKKLAFESAVKVKGSPKGQYDLDAVNKDEGVDLATVESQYIGCKHCGRTFLPDRLKVHEKNCRGK